MTTINEDAPYRGSPLERIHALTDEVERLKRAREKAASLLRECLICLEHCREAIGSLPIDALGEANDGEDVWPLRDELVDRITATVSAARAALRDEPAPGEQPAQEEGE